jgi:predicted phosphodiesterase
MPKNAAGTSEIKILHLSDLHYDSSNPNDTQIILNALWKDLENFPGIDFILFSGDLVKIGDKKEDFEKAFQVFIVPLFEKTQLNIGNFFISPGNHDIQRSGIDAILEEGLKVKLKDRDSLNAFLDAEKLNGYKHIERLDHFNDFKNRFKASHTVASNKLYSTHIIKKKNIKIGIACLNTAWRATGSGSQEKGQLLLGERQIDDSSSDIKDCDIKIGVYHHSLDWLMEYDLGNTKKRLSRGFDFLFCGHIHDPNLELVQNFQNKTLLTQCGSLNSGRIYYNGYSVVSLNVQNGTGKIKLRTYFDNRREFDKSIDACKKGELDIRIKMKNFKKKEDGEDGERAENGGSEVNQKIDWGGNWLGKQNFKTNDKIFQSEKKIEYPKRGENSNRDSKKIREQADAKKEHAMDKHFPPGEYFKCQRKPVRELVTSNVFYLQTEANEWISWTPDTDFPYSLFNTQPVSEAFIDREEQLVVGLFEQNVARLKEDKWEYIQWNHAVLSLVETDIGIVVGDSGGNLGLLKAQGKTSSSLTVQEPVKDILNINNEKLVFLGTKGGLWTTEWPFDRSAKVKTVNMKDFERIFGFIENKTTSGVILRGGARVALLYCESGKIENVSNSFEDSIRSVYANQGKTGGYAVLMDEGGLYLLSDDLKITNMVKISIDEGRMVGVRPLHKGGFLVWTTEGNLYRVEENSTFKQIANNHVVLAFPHRDDEGIYVVRWHEVKGIHIQFEHKRGSKK